PEGQEGRGGGKGGGGSRRGRRPQSAHGRPARRRQVDAGRAAADHPAAADAGGTARSLDDRVGRGRDRGRRAHQSPTMVLVGATLCQKDPVYIGFRSSWDRLVSLRATELGSK